MGRSSDCVRLLDETNAGTHGQCDPGFLTSGGVSTATESPPDTILPGTTTTVAQSTTSSFPTTDEVLQSLGGDLVFKDCELAAGLILDGTGGYDVEEDVFTLDVTIDGCDHVYSRAGEDYSVDSSC